jgi:hypothetical protein
LEQGFGAVMDAREHFQSVVVPNYNDFVQSPTEYRFLDNTLSSMNTVAERLGLHQLEYDQVGRGVLNQEAQRIRDQSSSLKDLKFCVETLKHGRKIVDHGGGKFTTIATSTGIDTNDPRTWKIGDHNLVQLAHSAFETLSKITELNAPST